MIRYQMVTYTRLGDKRTICYYPIDTSFSSIKWSSYIFYQLGQAIGFESCNKFLYIKPVPREIIYVEIAQNPNLMIQIKSMRNYIYHDRLPICHLGVDKHS